MEAIGYKDSLISLLSNELNISISSSNPQNENIIKNFHNLATPTPLDPLNVKLSQIALSPFLEEYLKEVEEHLKNAKGELNFEISARVVNLFNSISEYILYAVFGDRIKQDIEDQLKMNNLLKEILSGANKKCMDKAWEIVQRKLKINYNKYQSHLVGLLTDENVKKFNELNKFPPIPKMTSEQAMSIFNFVYPILLQVEENSKNIEITGGDQEAYLNWENSYLDSILYVRFGFSLLHFDHILIQMNLYETDDNVKAYLEKKKYI